MGSVLLARGELRKAGNPVTFDKSAYRIKLHLLAEQERFAYVVSRYERLRA